MVDKLAPVAGGIAETLVSDKFKNKVSEIKDTVFTDPILIADIEKLLLNEFGDEPFYNNLTRYIAEHNIIYLLIQMLNGKIDIESKNNFVNDNADRYISKYGCNPNEISNLKKAFCNIYENACNKKLALNAYSDTGKLQLDFHRYESQYNSDMEEVKDMMKTFLYNQELLSAQMGNVRVVAPDDIEDTSEKVDKFLEKIKDVGKENNPTENDEEAITKYTKLLADVPIELRGESQVHIDKVICNIKCHLALCYSNLGNTEEAFNQFNNIQPEVAKQSKLYHFAKAVIVVNHCIEDKYVDAMLSIEEALKLDPNYHRVVFIKHYLAALQKENGVEEIINSLDKYFKPIIDIEEDNSIIADYYVYRAFIYKEYDKHFEAIENHTLAIQYGYDEMVANYNIALSYYLIAVENIPKDTRKFGTDVKRSEIIKVIKILKPCLINNKQMVCHAFLKSRMIELYVSSCCLIGIKHKLNPISEYINVPGLSYDCVRGVILGSEGIISEENLSLLEDDDKLFAKVFNCSHNNDFDSIKNLFTEIDWNELSNLPQGLIYMLLQTCVISKDTSNYWKYRPLINNANNELIQCLDAYSYELEDKLEDAKEIVNKYASESKDYHILSNILNFYSRNKLDGEHEELLLRIFDLKNNEDIYIDDLLQFYGQAISFLTRLKSYNVEKFIDALTSEELPVEDVCKIKWNYYNAIGDVQNMYECISNIYELNQDFDNGYNKVVCEVKLMKYSEALSNSLTLFDSLGHDVEKKTKMMCMISDIYLFMNDNDNSFEWAKKAHEITIQNPHHDSHQFYMGRTTRTGHTEALSDTFEYKKTHPVVVGAWFKEFKISDDNPVESLTKAIEEMSGETHDEYVKREHEIARIYRSNIVSNSLLLKHYHQSLSNFFVFASQHKLSISQGNNKQLELEKDLIKDDIFVDALTLIVMKRYDCLEILNNIKNVHICYSTISYLQSFIGSLDAHYVIDILKWLDEAENIVFEIDGYKFDSLSPEFFSEEFLACCNAAVIKQLPILTVEPVVKLIQQYNLEIIPKGLLTVSLPGLCYSVLQNKPQELEKPLYNLLSECKFICFRADTILFQIKNLDYVIDKTALDRFFICDTTCDMISFANVYCGVINRLFETNVKAANVFTELVLKDSIRIWKQGSYYRYLLESDPDDIECVGKSEAIQQYIIYLTFAIKKIYTDIPNEIKETYNQVIEIIAHNISHEYVEKIKSTFNFI